MNTPLVSLVVPSFNQGKFIEETLQSVILQSYPNLELLVMDGGSTDNTVEILKKYSRKIARWVSEPDQGQTDAINKGWRFATGEFLGWINSDDLLLPDAITRAVAYLNAHDRCGFVYGDLIMIDANGGELGVQTYEEFDLTRLVSSAGWISQPGNLFRRATYEAIGELDASLHFQMDLDYWIRTALRYDVGYLRCPLAKFRQHENSKTSSRFHLAADDILKIYRKLYARNDLPVNLIKCKKLAWANAYSYSSALLCASERFSESYRHLFRAVQLYPRILFQRKHLRRLVALLVLSALGGKNTGGGQAVDSLWKKIQGESATND